MPSHMIFRLQDNDSNPNRVQWKAGESTNVLDDSVKTVGWREFYQNTVGQRTVAEINGFDAATANPCITVRMLDSGTINTLTNGPLSVSAGDAIALMFDRNWYNYGPKEAVANNRVIVRISDKDKEDLIQYTETFNKKIDMNTINGPDGDGVRRIKIDVVNLSNDERNGFTQEGVDNILLAWNEANPYPSPPNPENWALVQIGATTPGAIVLQGRFLPGQYEEFEEIIITQGLADTVNYGKWYLSSDGIAEVMANDGYINWTAQELGQYWINRETE